MIMKTNGHAITMLIVAVTLICGCSASPPIGLSTLQLNASAGYRWLYVSETGNTAVAVPSSCKFMATIDLNAMAVLAEVKMTHPFLDEYSVAVTDSTAVVSTPVGLLAFSVKTGETLWLNKKKSFASAPAVVVSKDLVVVIDAGTTLVGLSLATGLRRWTTPGVFANRKPLVASYGDLVLTETGKDSVLSAFSTANGNPVWTAAANLHPFYKPLAATMQAFPDTFLGNAIVALTLDAKSKSFSLVRIEAASGLTAWNISIEKPVTGAPLGSKAVTWTDQGYWVIEPKQLTVVQQPNGAIIRRVPAPEGELIGVLNLGNNFMLPLSQKPVVPVLAMSGADAGRLNFPGAPLAWSSFDLTAGCAVLTDTSAIVRLLVGE